MIVMIYFTYHPNTVGTLYLCVCVCVFSVLGSTMRICLLFRRRGKTIAVSPVANSSDMTIEADLKQ